VTFEGRVGLTGYLPDELDVLVHGTKMKLLYPEGFTTLVDTADLNLRGTITAPELVGKILINRATLTRPFEGGTGLLGYVLSAEGSGANAPLPQAPATPTTTIPLRYDINITAPPGSITIANRTANITGHANLSFTGTYAKPVVNGRVDIERGNLFFEGNPYQFTRGSIEFIDPNTIRPFFDFEVETHVRVPVPGQDAQNFTVRVDITGTKDRLTPTFQSDPPLPNVDVLALLFGDTPDIQRAELNAVGSQQQSEQNLMRAGVARLLTSPLSTQVGNVAAAVGVDQFAFTPRLGSASSAQINPSALVTVGRRLSSRAFVYYSRELNSTQGTPYEVYVLEFEENDRITWVVSRNEDQTFSLDFRVRYVF
jgi:translocation and assembly module TamB